MLHAKSLPQRLWAEALNCETYIQNRSPHRYVKDKTPYEAWSGLKPEVTHFHIFGSRAWAQIPSEKRKALDPQRTECIFVGYPDGVKGYRLIDISSDRLIIEQVSNLRKVSRMYLSNHMQTPSFFHLSEMMSMHMSTLLQMRVMIQRTQMIQIQSQYSQMQSQSIQMQLQSQSRGPSGHKLLFRMQGISLVIQPILGGLDLISRSLCCTHFH
jgi:hypothetical protein